MSKTTYTPLQFQGMPFWVRLRMGVSLLLTPLTVVFMGRSIRVEWDQGHTDLMLED